MYSEYDSLIADRYTLETLESLDRKKNYLEFCWLLALLQKSLKVAAALSYLYWSNINVAAAASTGEITMHLKMPKVFGQ